MQKKYVSSSLERKIIGYPKPRLFELFLGEASMKFRKESEHFNRILEERYEKYSPSDIRALQQQYTTIVKPEKDKRKKSNNSY